MRAAAILYSVHLSDVFMLTRPQRFSKRCNVISQQWDTRLSLLNRLSTPEWLAHVVFMRAGDGDIVLLKEQESLLPRVPKGWRAFYMPTKVGGC